MCKCVVAEFFQHKVTVTLVCFYFLTVIMLDSLLLILMRLKLRAHTSALITLYFSLV